MIITDILNRTKIIPIAILNDISNALKIAELLLENSIQILEITLRTSTAFSCIREISKTFPEMLVGSGSVLSKDALVQAMDAGAKFGVAPSLDMEIVNYSFSRNINFIPGVTTPTELNNALKAGIGIVKIFPTVCMGGIDYIKAITAPFEMIDYSIIPTGGINETNITDYLQLKRVIACGGSYIVDRQLIEAGEFAELDKRIKTFTKLLSK